MKINIGLGNEISKTKKYKMERFFEEDVMQVRHATKVSTHVNLKGCLYFTLEWENDRELNEKNVSKYVSMNDLENYNPRLLLGYFKKHMIFKK